MSFRAFVIVLAVSCIVSIGIGWKWRDYQATADALDSANNALASVKTALVNQGLIALADAEKSKTLEQVLVAMQEAAEAQDKEAEKDYEKEVIYTSCIVPDSGVQRINARVAESGITANTGKR